MMDMFSEARQMAAQFREVFEAFIFVGFTEQQAMQMVLALMSAPIRG
jgi:hypothetical protein